METKQLKNIAILILLLLNGFLLVLLGYQDLQAVRASQMATEELKSLFAAEELALELTPDMLEESLAPLTLSRQMDRESRIAEFLLGQAPPAENQGGGINSYRSDVGTVQFRAGGGFDTVQLDLPVGDVNAYTEQFCDRFNYKDVEYQTENNVTTVTARQYVAGVPIFGCYLILRFEADHLTYAAGAHIDLGDAVTDSEHYLDCISALVRFLDYRRDAGIVCSKVRDVRCVYQLNSTVTPPRLLPVWEIETDTYTYLVDGISSQVTRK